MLSRTICPCASVANASVKAIEVQSSWVTPDTLLYMCNLEHISVLHAHLMGNSPATRSANHHPVTRLPIRHLLPSRPKPIRSKFVHSERRRGVRPFARNSEQFVLRLLIGQHENAAYFFYPRDHDHTLGAKTRRTVVARPLHNCAFEGRIEPQPFGHQISRYTRFFDGLTRHWCMNGNAATASLSRPSSGTDRDGFGPAESSHRVEDVAGNHGPDSFFHRRRPISFTLMIV
jgi:hypothetical protein